MVGEEKGERGGVGGGVWRSNQDCFRLFEFLCNVGAAQVAPKKGSIRSLFVLKAEY